MKTQQFKKAQQSGFTLIELVMVIVILGILAAVAVPKFVDLAAEARTAVINGAKGAIESTAVILYASNKALPTTAQIEAGLAVTGVTVAAIGASCAFTITPTGGGSGTVYSMTSGNCSG